MAAVKWIVLLSLVCFISASGMQEEVITKCTTEAKVTDAESEELKKQFEKYPVGLRLRPTLEVLGDERTALLSTCFVMEFFKQRLTEANLPSEYHEKVLEAIKKFPLSNLS